jgi:hypothetical protein
MYKRPLIKSFDLYDLKNGTLCATAWTQNWGNWTNGWTAVWV